MTEQGQLTHLTEFGEVLAEFMEEKGIAAEPEQIRALAERAGLDPDKLLARVTGEGGHEGYLDKLAEELDLGGHIQWVRLAKAYAYKGVRQDMVEQFTAPPWGYDQHLIELLARDHDLWADPSRHVEIEDDLDAADQYGQAEYFADSLSDMANHTESPLNTAILNIMSDAADRAREAERRHRKRLEEKKSTE